MYLRNYRMQNVWLLMYLKCSVSEHLRTTNMLKGAKDYLNVQKSSFLTFFHHSEITSVRNILFQ